MDIKQFKAQVDIVDLIGQTVDLHQSGHNWSGLCPFHDEDTPSFYVAGDRQNYHCFGCQAKGDVLDFVQNLQHASLGEAIDWLCEHYHLDPPARDPADIARRARLRETLADLRAAYDAAPLESAWSDLAIPLALGRGHADITTEYFTPDERVAIDGRLVLPLYRGFDLVSFAWLDEAGEHRQEARSGVEPAGWFALPVAREHWKTQPPLVCQAAADALRLHANGQPSAIATVGTPLRRQIETVKANNPRVRILVPDDSEAAWVFPLAFVVAGLWVEIVTTTAGALTAPQYVYDAYLDHAVNTGESSWPNRLLRATPSASTRAIYTRALAETPWAGLSAT